MAQGTTQTALVQASTASKPLPGGPLPLELNRAAPLPRPPAHHVLVRVLAVALNPTDHKMPTYFPEPGATAGCDFCGVVVAVGDDSSSSSSSTTTTNLSIPLPITTAPFPTPSLPPGTRVCGSVFGYNPSLPLEGAFAQHVVADARQLLRVPASWTDTQAAALGGTGWRTAALALWDAEHLALGGRPSCPVEDTPVPVLVYGGATATGTMACQLLRASGYAPVAVASPAGQEVARAYGAVGTASYVAGVEACVREIRAAVGGGGQVRHALDCVTDAESAAACFGVLARSGGRYACLEAFEEAWRTRRAVRASVVMAFETTGVAVDLGEGSVYTRPARADRHALGVEAAREVQALLDRGEIRHHPVREVGGGWEGILEGLRMLRSGKVRGEKLVVRIPQE